MYVKFSMCIVIYGWQCNHHPHCIYKVSKKFYIPFHVNWRTLISNFYGCNLAWNYVKKQSNLLFTIFDIKLFKPKCLNLKSHCYCERIHTYRHMNMNWINYTDFLCHQQTKVFTPVTSLTGHISSLLNSGSVSSLLRPFHGIISVNPGSTILWPVHVNLSAPISKYTVVWVYLQSGDIYRYTITLHRNFWWRGKNFSYSLDYCWNW